MLESEDHRVRGANTASVFGTMRRLFQPQPVAFNPDADTRKFIDSFSSTYSSDHVNFVDGSYKTCVANAFRQSKLLLIYLHSPLHEDTDNFCQQVLCSPAFCQFTNDNFICWGVLMCQSENTVEIVERIEGVLDEQAITGRLQNCANVQNRALDQTRMQNNMRSEASMLRAQQDREFQEGLERDRKARLKREQEEIEEFEAEQEEELNKAIAFSEQCSQLSQFEELRKKVGEEVAAVPEAALIRFQLPSQGKGNVKILRRFLKTDTVQSIHDFLALRFFDEHQTATAGAPSTTSSTVQTPPADAPTMVKNFSVSTNFPKKVLSDMSNTIDAEGLYPKGVLFVTDLDA